MKQKAIPLLIISAALVLLALSVLNGGGGRNTTLNSPKDDAPSAGQISEITYERIFGCDGQCPLYKVVLRRDGTASYIGTDHAERKGKYRALYTDYYFNRIAKLIERNRYLSFKDQYGPTAEDQGVVIIGIVSDGKKKIVTNHGSEGPLELWEIEMTLEGAMSQIDWEKEH